MKRTLLSFALLFVAASSQAAIIIDNTVSGTVTNTFDALADGNVSGLISQTGSTYGERFAGQTLSTAGGFDSLSGTPSSPLNLLANATTNDNIGILDYGSSQVIYGDLSAQIGEGALSVLLSDETDVFGFNIIGSHAGNFTAQFFAADGSLLGALTQNISADGFFGFRATAGDRIAGVSINNNDFAGIAYDNVTFNQLPGTTIPEPATLALLGLGLAGLGLARRRKA